MKRCTHCKQDLPLIDFGRHAKTKDGLQSWCKPCKRRHQGTTLPPRPQAPAGMKWCRKCEEFVGTTEFYRSVTNRDGLHSWCRTCMRAAKAYERGTIIPPSRSEVKIDKMKCVGCQRDRPPDSFPDSILDPAKRSHRCNDCWPKPAQRPELRRATRCKTAA